MEEKGDCTVPNYKQSREWHKMLENLKEEKNNQE
jgi:hypothetical protein